MVEIDFLFLKEFFSHYTYIIERKSHREDFEKFCEYIERYASSRFTSAVFPDTRGQNEIEWGTKRGEMSEARKGRIACRAWRISRFVYDAAARLYHDARRWAPLSHVPRELAVAFELDGALVTGRETTRRRAKCTPATA